MSDEFLEAGKIVATHGLKGEMRVQPWSDDANFLSGFENIYLDNAGQIKYKILRAVKHGNVTLLRLEGVESVSDAEKFRDKIVYIKKSDADFGEGRYFIQDIIGLKIIDEDSAEELGVVKDVEKYPANDVWLIKTADGSEVYIPNIPPVVKKIDIAAGKVFIFKMKGLF